MSIELGYESAPNDLKSAADELKRHLGESIEAHKQIDPESLTNGQMVYYALQAAMLKVEADFISSLDAQIQEHTTR